MVAKWRRVFGGNGQARWGAGSAGEFLFLAVIGALILLTAWAAFANIQRRGWTSDAAAWAQAAGSIAAYQDREKRRLAFVDLIASKLEQRSKLANVLAYADKAGDAAMPPGISTWLSRSIAEIDALLSPLFLEISALRAKIDFDEAAFASKPSEPAWYYPREVSLELWELNQAEGNATLQSPLEWALAQGLIPNVAEPGPDGE